MDLAKVYWKKKQISAELIDNTVNRKEAFVSSFEQKDFKSEFFEYLGTSIWLYACY